MSIDLEVYLRRALMPSPTQWDQAIREAGFPIELDTDFDPDEFSGFLPCRFRSEDSGFEYSASEMTDEMRDELGAPDDSDFCVIFTTQSDLREFATSLIASSVLCHVTGGVLVDPQEGQEFPADAVLEWAREQLDEIEKHLA